MDTALPPPTRHFTVCYSDPTVISKAGFGKVAELPFILDSRPGYHRLGSQYLIDRGLRVWAPKKARTDAPALDLIFPLTWHTLDSYADWLANFLEWADVRHVDLATCTYVDHVHGRYQQELIDGTWSRDGVGLRPKTVNAYVGQACEFLEWMADKGKRAYFHVPKITRVAGGGSSRDAKSHKSKEVEVRKGKVKERKRRLRMPSDGQLEAWLSSIYQSREEPYGLMCESVLYSAIRRSEVVGFRVDTLPLNPDDWHIANPTANEASQLVLISIKFGTKGPSYGMDHGDKVGPSRDIQIPLHLALKLHAYRERVRPRILNGWVKQVRGAAAQSARRDDAVHLFLDPDTGERVSGWRFYKAWKAGTLPYPNWSPHFGRDWWACMTLLREVKAQEHILKLGPNASGALIAAAATDIIRLKIQPQLGHAKLKTCFIYLQWLTDMLGVALPELYQRHLDNS